MDSTLSSQIQRYGFALSLLLHLLLLASFSMVWTFTPQQQDHKPSLYIPSYTQQEDPTNASQPHEAQPKASRKEEATKKPDDLPLKPVKESKPSEKDASSPPKASSRPVTEVRSNQTTQPVHLVGDKPNDQPLIELLGKALAAHLQYPKIAIDFNLRGTVYVGFDLHTSGLVSNVRVMKSSGTDVLDQAALEGVRAMSPVSNVNQYLPQNRFLVVGIIFG